MGKISYRSYSIAKIQGKKKKRRCILPMFRHLNLLDVFFSLTVTSSLPMRVSLGVCCWQSQKDEHKKVHAGGAGLHQGTARTDAPRVVPPKKAATKGMGVYIKCLTRRV